jgi:hypothetical protein
MHGNRGIRRRPGDQGNRDGDQGAAIETFNGIHGDGFQGGEVRILVLPRVPVNNAPHRLHDVSPTIETSNE